MLALFLSAIAIAKTVQRCDIPVYMASNTTPAPYQEIFETSLHEALDVWNSSGANVRLVYAAVMPYEWIPGGIVVRWSTDRGSVPNSTANTYARQIVSGEITRAKVELLSDEPWCTSDTRSECFDMKNALIHELGHALGLDHSDVSESVMKQGMWLGEPPQYVLHETDRASLFRLYPYDQRGCSGTDYSFVWSTLGSWVADN